MAEIKTNWKLSDLKPVKSRMSEVFGWHYDTAGNMHYMSTDGVDHFIRMQIDPVVFRNGDEVVIHGGHAKELILCKDCDSWDEEYSSGRKSLGNYRCICHEWSNEEDGHYRYTAEDDFCSYAERREE